MLSAPRPSRSITSRATPRIRSREREVSAALRICTVYSTVYSGRRGNGVAESIDSASARLVRARRTADLHRGVGRRGRAGARLLARGPRRERARRADRGAPAHRQRRDRRSRALPRGARHGAAARAAAPACRMVAAGVFVAAGVALALPGVFRLDCGPELDAHCRALWRAGELSWEQDAHVWTAFAGELLLVATPFALAAALWPAPSGLAALGAGTFGLLAGVLSTGGYEAGAGDGLVQRLGLAILHLWVVIVAVGVLYELRGPSRFSELIPLRPRDFLA